MSKRPVLTTTRAVEIFEEMVSCRRAICADNEFIRMDTVWEDLCDEAGNWSIKTYRSGETEDFKRKAAVIAFDDKVMMTVDEKLMIDARLGCMLSGFILAHELAHVALGHHAKGAVNKHFQLFAGPRGMSNLPPSLEELEANYGAVFFQCGFALHDTRLTALDLARRAFSNVEYVAKAQRVVRLEVFQTVLNRPRKSYPRVVL